MKTKSMLIGLSALVLACAACRDNGPASAPDPESGPDPGTGPDLVTVVGVIVEKDDQVPVDGGVAMVLERSDGGTERLLFGSLFTSPPPSQAQIDLYGVITQVELGDVVNASGHRSDGTIVLEALTIQNP